MSDTPINAFDIGILEPAVNRDYLPQPIPSPRDNEIVGLLSQVVAENRVAQFARQVKHGHAVVLRVFAERAAATAVRNSDPPLLRMAMIGLLLSWSELDSRETLIVFPVLYDAILRMGIDVEIFAASIRRTVGDQLALPLENFLKRSEHNKSLESMGYTTEGDGGGFRYVRTW